MHSAIAADADWLRAHCSPFDAVGDPRGRISLAPRPPGFATLIRLILEQQVSTLAAAAMWRKLCARIDPVTPARLRMLDEATLKTCGFSRPKIRYALALADAVDSGSIRLDDLAAEDDDEAVIAALTTLPGIGRWTAENYLLWALGRRDVLPAGDLALLVGWQRLSGAATRPDPRTLRDIAQAWRPRRSAASYLLWHHYLSCS